MLMSTKRDNMLTLNSTVSDNQKEDIPTDYCSSFYSNNYHHLIQSQQFNSLLKEDKTNKLQAKMLLQRLNSLRIMQSSMTQKFDMCIKKLQNELESKEAQNDFVKEEIVSIKKDMKETRGDILLIKEYLSKQENKKVRGKRCSNFDELKELKGLKHHRLYKN